MSPEVKSAWIGSGSALVIAVISAITTYFVSVENQTSQPEPIIIKEPYIITQKEIIREYYPAPQADTQKSTTTKEKPIASTVTPPVIIKQLDAASQFQQKTDNSLNIAELFMGKTIGIYYSYGDKKTKSIASQLVAKMSSQGLNASFYSIGRFYSQPKIPDKTYLYGIGDDVDISAFKKSFKQTFHFTSALQPFNKSLDDQPIIDGDEWLLTTDKDVYIIIGR